MEEPEQYDDDMLQELDFDPSQIEEIDNTNEAGILGDQYLPLMQSGYMFESQGYEATQEYLSKFYDGLTLDKDLSSRENLVVKNNNNTNPHKSWAPSSSKPMLRISFCLNDFRFSNKLLMIPIN